MLPLLSLSTMDPVRAPVAVGVKVTDTVQVPPGISGLGQLLVWAKSPVAAMLAKVRFALPTFPTVKVCGALVVPTVCAAKVKLVGFRHTCVAGPYVRIMCALPRSLLVTTTFP